jgi:hypothetical protein
MRTLGDPLPGKKTRIRLRFNKKPGWVKPISGVDKTS